jgi:hypothetical protein
MWQLRHRNGPTTVQTAATAHFQRQDPKAKKKTGGLNGQHLVLVARAV